MADPHISKVSVHFLSVLEAFSPHVEDLIEDDAPDEWDLEEPLGLSITPVTVHNNATPQQTEEPMTPPSPKRDLLSASSSSLPKPVLLDDSETLTEPKHQNESTPWKMPVIDRTHKSTFCLFVPFHDNGEDEDFIEFDMHTETINTKAPPLPTENETIKFTSTSSLPTAQISQNTPWVTPERTLANRHSQSFSLDRSKSFVVHKEEQKNNIWKAPVPGSKPKKEKTHRRNISLGDARTPPRPNTKMRLSTLPVDAVTQKLRARSSRVVTRPVSPLRRIEVPPPSPQPIVVEKEVHNDCQDKSYVSSKSLLPTNEFMRKVKLTRRTIFRSTVLLHNIPFPVSTEPSHETHSHLSNQTLVNSIGKNDKSSLSICSACSLVFSFTMRRHRCRNCANFFCQSCSSNKIKVPHKGYRKKMRVCDPCFKQLSELESIADKNFLQTHHTIHNSYKLVFMGPSGAGKTSFVQNSVHGYCPAEGELYSMLGVVTAPFDFQYDLRNSSITVPFHIWDIHGNQRYFPLLDCYCEGLDCCILAFDVSGHMELDDLVNPWLNTIRKFDRTNTIVVLLGLKSESQRTISKESATLFAKTQAMDLYLEASTHSGSNLHAVYKEITSLLIERQVREEIIFPKTNSKSDEPSELVQECDFVLD